MSDLKKGDKVLVKAEVVHVNSQGGIDILIETMDYKKRVVYDVDPGDMGKLEIDDD